MTYLKRVINKSEAKQTFKADSTTPFTTVFRMENSRGQGPYTAKGQDGKSLYEWGDVWEADDSGEEDPSRHRNSGEHPNPLLDDGFDIKEKALVKNKDVRFGFVSMDQLKSWFNPHEIKNLDRLGFKIKEHKASVVWDSGKQCMFLPFKTKD